MTRYRYGPLVLLAWAALTAAACGGSGDSRSANVRNEARAPEGRKGDAQPASRETRSWGADAPRATAAPAATRPRIVILGDSLTAGLGLPQEQAYPTLLQQRIDAEHLPFEVVNAGVSGDTSAGGLSRLDWALGDGKVAILVVALGGNDALRGLPVKELSRNLSTIIERAQALKIKVILAGMEAPPNFGRDYIVSFHQVYPELARKYDIPLLPFLLDGVAGISQLNQSDGIHPTAEGARRVADNVWTVLRPMLTTS
jgi:acyl-CoA thioesterase-1